MVGASLKIASAPDRHDGSLPCEWTLTRLRDVLVQDATYGIVKAGTFVRRGVPMLRGGDIKNGRIARDMPHVSETKSEEFKRTVLRDSDVVISLVGYPILATGGQIGAAKSFLYDRPSVLIGRKGTIDRPQYIETPFWTVDTLFYSVMNGENSAKFFFYRFCLIDWYSHNEASGVPSLNARTIERIEVTVPEPDEQQAIAGVLSEMDEELEALNERLAKARQIKQGMTQELLAGRVRLV